MRYQPRVGAVWPKGQCGQFWGLRPITWAWALSLSVLCAHGAHSQDINFADLRRAGPPVLKSYVIANTLLDAEEALQAFQGSDDARIAQRRSQSSATSESRQETGTTFKVVRDNGRAASWQWFERSVDVECIGGREKGKLTTLHFKSTRWHYQMAYPSLAEAGLAACPR